MDTPQRRNIIDRTFAFLDALPTADRFLVKLFGTLFAASLLWLVLAVNAASLIAVPGTGGTLREGVVGTPRFINPVLAVTAADLDLTELVYAGVLRRDGDGALVPDIAESVEVSEDGLTYAIQLREDVQFHDGAPLTADDVIFTIGRVQDPALQSPLRASWEGVSALKLNDRELQVVLPAAYAPFQENLTLGILPKHIWEHASTEELPFSQYNSEPIGAGPYRIEKIERDNSGIPQSYELVPNQAYFGERPKIQKLIFNFYPTEDALVADFLAGKLDSAGGLDGTSLAKLEESSLPLAFHTTPLPRTFALFFNQNEQPLFRDASVREALAVAVDRERMVREVLGGRGQAIQTPIPPGFGMEVATPEGGGMADLDAARERLRRGGWSINEETGLWEKETDEETRTLSVDISTANTPFFGQTANILKERWEELGVPTNVRQFEQSNLSQSVIRPRAYETLLFGTVVGRELDFFSFWHSSQRNDPGLNVALYANITTDGLLTDARVTADEEARAEIFADFSDELVSEVPAIFLYVPTYTYVTPASVRNISLERIARGHERLSTVAAWHVERESVWPLFANTDINTD